MPIVDVEMVCQSEAEFNAVSARALADALGQTFDSAAGHTWVRMRFLPISAYAENEVTVSTAELPVFVTVLQSQTPAIVDFAPFVELITSVFAAAVGRSRERVHVEYAPPGAGRQAFGGQLV